MAKIITSCALALMLVGGLAFEAGAQSSCSGWHATCQSRCKSSGDCSYCANQMASCKSSGCWKEGAKFGGAKHCGLKK